MKLASRIVTKTLKEWELGHGAYLLPIRIETHATSQPMARGCAA